MSLAEPIVAVPARPADRLDVRAVLILIACCACWGVNQVAIKIASEGISPILQAGLRSLLSGALVLIWARARGIALFRRDGTLWPGVFAGILFGIEFLILYVGLSLTTASRGVLFLYLSPFVVAFGAHYLIAGDRLNIWKLLGLTAAFIGLGVAMREGLSAPGQPTLTGDLMCLAAAVIWGATTVLVRATALKSAAPEKTLLYQLVVLRPDLAASVLARRRAGPRQSEPTGDGGLCLHLCGRRLHQLHRLVLAGAELSATRVTAFTFLSPVFGVAAGNLMLGEAFTSSLAAALVLIAFGIYLVNRPHCA